MTACSAVAPTVTSQVIKSNLHVSSELVEQLYPMELSSVNELLDCIAALGVATDYDQVGLKPDLREINSPQVIHHVAEVETLCGDPSSILRTSYVRIPDPSKLDTRGGGDITQDLSLGSGNGPDSLDNIQESKLHTNGYTPFFMVYGAEAVLPCDIIHDSPRMCMYEEREVELDRQDSLDTLEEERDVEKARSAFYQQ